MDEVMTRFKSPLMLWRPKNVSELNDWKEQFLKQAKSYAYEFSLQAAPSTTWAGRHNERAKELILKLNKHPHRFDIEISKSEYKPLIVDMGKEKLTSEYVVQMAEQILQERKDRKTKRGRKHLYLNLQMELLSILLHLRFTDHIPKQTSLKLLKNLLAGNDSELAQSLATLGIHDISWNGRFNPDDFQTLNRIDLELRSTIVNRILAGKFNFHFKVYSELQNQHGKSAITKSSFVSQAKKSTLVFRDDLFKGLLICARKRPLKCNPDEALRKQEHDTSCVTRKINFCGHDCDFYKVVYRASEACAKIGYE